MQNSNQEEADKKVRELAAQCASISEVIIDHATTHVEGGSVERSAYFAVLGKGGTAVFDSFDELREHVEAVHMQEQLQAALRNDKREEQRRQELALERGREYRGFDEPPPVLKVIQRATAVKQKALDTESVKREIAQEVAPVMRDRIAHRQAKHVAHDNRVAVKMAAAKKPAATVPAASHDEDLAHQRKTFVHQHQSRSFVPKFRDVFGPKKH